MQVGLGCVNLASASAAGSWSDHVRLVHSAIDAGISVFDTADAYGAGSSELALGRALRGRRDKAIVATKVGYTFRERRPFEQRLRRNVGRAARAARRARRVGDDDRSGTQPDQPAGRGAYAVQDFSPSHIRAALDASLRRLQCDYVDVYQLHGPPPDAALDDVIAQLADLRAAGKVRRFGIGAESIEAAAHWNAVHGIEVVQLPFGVLDPEAASGVLPALANRRVDAWVRGVLGGGVIGAALRDPSRIASHPKRGRVDMLAGIAAAADLALDELALRWVLGYDVAVVVLGMSSPASLSRNLSLLARGPLDPSTKSAVDATLS